MPRSSILGLRGAYLPSTEKKRVMSKRNNTDEKGSKIGGNWVRTGNNLNKGERKRDPLKCEQKEGTKRGLTPEGLRGQP